MVLGLVDQHSILHVCARNSSGWGDWAAAESSASGPPSHPTNGVLNPEHDSITVTWDAPTRSCGSPIRGYQVSFKVEESDLTDTGFGGTGTRYTIEGLQHSTHYEVFVRANNDFGSGPWWSQKTMTAAPPDKPEEPEPPTAVPSTPRELVLGPGNANMLVGWQLPASTGDSPIERPHPVHAERQRMADPDRHTRRATALPPGRPHQRDHPLRTRGRDQPGRNRAMVGDQERYPHGTTAAGPQVARAT